MSTPFDGLGMSLGNLSRLSDAETRSISAENPTGEPGQGGRATEGVTADVARELGQGWKISPAVSIHGHSTVTLADVEGPGAIQHIWITSVPQFWRQVVLRFYWDEETEPSIEVPLGDFFCTGWGAYAQVSSEPVAVNPAGGFNCYWQMPFRRRARITAENLGPDFLEGFFYQITYTRTPIAEDQAYLHAQYRRSNPVPYGEVHTLVDGVAGRGQFVGTYLAWQSNNNGWWGEGEVKFYLDDDDEFPSICGTGTEDYFGGAWAFEDPPGRYREFTTPYLGMPQVITGDGFNRSQQRFSLYRWHVLDPIRFRERLRVTVQALGHRSTVEDRPRYMPLKDDIASVVWWYQTEPHTPFPELPSVNDLEVI